MKLDILAFGAHPDDVELAVAGILMMEKKAGKKIGVIDLTQGELGTRGTAETRKTEADAASIIMQLDVRDNLELADGFFENDMQSKLKVIAAIRKYQPSIIMCNAPYDRHPDHGRGAQLLEEASFLAGLRKIETFDKGIAQAPWKPSNVFNYVQDHYLQPNFVYDISPVMEQKLEAIRAYGTQFFSTNSNEPQTYISTPNFLDSIVYRAKMYGKMIGVPYAEGLISKKMIGIKSFDALVSNIT
jgi:N-acetylglucosamine malate deacetylase 1